MIAPFLGARIKYYLPFAGKSVNGMYRPAADIQCPNCTGRVYTSGARYVFTGAGIDLYGFTGCEVLGYLDDESG